MKSMDPIDWPSYQRNWRRFYFRSYYADQVQGCPSPSLPSLPPTVEFRRNLPAPEAPISQSYVAPGTPRNFVAPSGSYTEQHMFTQQGISYPGYGITTLTNAPALFVYPTRRLNLWQRALGPISPYLSPAYGDTPQKLVQLEQPNDHLRVSRASLILETFLIGLGVDTPKCLPRVHQQQAPSVRYSNDTHAPNATDAGFWLASCRCNAAKGQTRGGKHAAPGFPQAQHVYADECGKRLQTKLQPSP
ncbi:hypothetical protein BC835DRAFT_550252 [Cytidiella melzeri]|nr:hypothetical protein BC835DRAFT_550252 [Cytidiella melzeri]